MKLSKQKKDKISEQILSFLYSSFPKLIFTSHIAAEIARDEEFVKSLLLNLKKKNLVAEIKKNPQGLDYARRSRSKLSDIAYEKYKSISQ